jgi:hypothetical protein
MHKVPQREKSRRVRISGTSVGLFVYSVYLCAQSRNASTCQEMIVRAEYQMDMLT